MAQQLLYCTDVITRLKKMSCERMSQAMGTNLLGNSGFPSRLFNGALQRAFIKMVSPHFA